MRWTHQEDVEGWDLPAVFRAVTKKQEKLVLWEDQGKAAVSSAPWGQPGQVENFSSLRDWLAAALQSHHLIRGGIRIAAHQQASLQSQHNILLLPLLKHEAPCGIRRKIFDLGLIGWKDCKERLIYFYIEDWLIFFFFNSFFHLLYWLDLLAILAFSKLLICSKKLPFRKKWKGFKKVYTFMNMDIETLSKTVCNSNSLQQHSVVVNCYWKMSYR